MTRSTSWGTPRDLLEGVQGSAGAPIARFQATPKYQLLTSDACLQCPSQPAVGQRPPSHHHHPSGACSARVSTYMQRNTLTRVFVLHCLCVAGGAV